MFRISRLNAVVVPLAALVTLLTLACHRAEAQVKPFKITGEGGSQNGITVDGTSTTHFAVGVANELGKYRGDGTFKVVMPKATGLGANQFSFSSGDVDFTFAAANGDKLVCTYGKGKAGPGVVTVTQVGTSANYTAFFVAEFNPVPGKCTGRFTNVTGSFIVSCQSGPFTFVSATATSSFAYTWQGEGTLIFPQAKKK